MHLMISGYRSGGASGFQLWAAHMLAKAACCPVSAEDEDGHERRASLRIDHGFVRACLITREAFQSVASCASVQASMEQRHDFTSAAARLPMPRTLFAFSTAVRS